MKYSTCKQRGEQPPRMWEDKSTPPGKRRVFTTSNDGKRITHYVPVLMLPESITAKLGTCNWYT